MTAMLLVLYAFFPADPAPNKTENDPIAEARRLLSSYQIVTLKHGDDRWEFEPAAKGEKGVKARRTKGDTKTEFTISKSAIGEVVGLTGAITDQKENFIALGVACSNADHSEIEYRTLTVYLNQDPDKSDNWTPSQVLVTSPIGTPYPMMAVTITHGDSLTFLLQRMERGGSTTIEGYAFVDHCIGAGMKETPLGVFERFEFALKEK